MLRRQLAAIRVRDRTAFGDADQGIVRFVVIDRAKVWLVGRNERDIPRIGKVEQMRFDRALCRKSVALQLDVQPITEELQQGRAATFGQVELPGSDGLLRAPAGPPVSAIRPVLACASAASVICGGSFAVGSRNARDESRMTLR